MEKQSNNKLENLLFMPLLITQKYLQMLNELLSKTIAPHPDINDLTTVINALEQLNDFINKAVNLEKVKLKVPPPPLFLLSFSFSLFLFSSYLSLCISSFSPLSLPSPFPLPSLPLPSPFLCVLLFPSTIRLSFLFHFPSFFLISPFPHYWPILIPFSLGLIIPR